MSRFFYVLLKCELLINQWNKYCFCYSFIALCKDDANGNVPLGKSCNRYWACQGGYPRLQRCPAMLVFDKQRKRCVAPPTADCDVPPPPPPSEDDDFNGNRDDQNRPNRYILSKHPQFLKNIASKSVILSSNIYFIYPPIFFSLIIVFQKPRRR